MNGIEEMLKELDEARAGNHKVQPGHSYRISEAASVGDGVWQGDLGLEIIDSIPKGYTNISNPTEAALKLVPGQTQGSRHCLDSLDGVELYWPPNYGENYNGLMGPAFKLNKERTVKHPVHGDVTIPKGFTISCNYQREYDFELRKERRMRD